MWLSDVSDYSNYCMFYELIKQTNKQICHQLSAKAGKKICILYSDDDNTDIWMCTSLSAQSF